MANNPPCADSIGYSFDIGKLVAGRIETMPASEQMFFFGAPFAHVVQYEEQLRANRHEKNLRRLARLHAVSRRHV